MPSKCTPNLNINEFLDLQDRGLHYGDGLFETLLKRNGKIVYWDDHFDRLSNGCIKLHLPIPDETWLLQKLGELSDSDLVIKIIVTRGLGGRGLSRPDPNQPSVYILSYPYTFTASEKPALAVSLCQTLLPINRNLAGLKHLNRLDYVLAAIELEDKENRDEGILCDTAGYLVESIISNLFFCIKGRVYTPSLKFSGVEGIMRRQILKYFATQNIEVNIGRFPVALLSRASECFLTNSVQGIRPVKSIDQQSFVIGPVYKKLAKIFNLDAPDLTHWGA